MADLIPSFQTHPLIQKIEKEGLGFMVWNPNPPPNYGLINPAFAQRVSDLIPQNGPFIGGPQILYLIGVPLRTDENIPSGEIHFYVDDKFSGKIGGLEND